MRKLLLFNLLFFMFIGTVIAQDCKTEYQDYVEKLRLDNSIFFNSTMELNQSQTFAKNIIDSIKPTACPFKIKIAFVIELDSSLSNIFVCAKMNCFNSACDEAIEKLKFESDILNYFKSLKLKQGTYDDGILIRSHVAIPLHFECQ
ncbi:MAG TPA: hypothetical protein DCQ31_03830 [Bacteroidales bacterium]|nr:hypothetical protein [Bacteroidales bacterium]